MTQTKTITINFIMKDGKTKKVQAPVGLSLLHAAQMDRQTYLDGSCGGVMACTTCHVVVDEAWYVRIPEISEEENDTLDMAFNVKPTSRLGCQIVLTEDMDGLTVKIPEEDAV